MTRLPVAQLNFFAYFQGILDKFIKGIKGSVKNGYNYYDMCKDKFDNNKTRANTDESKVSSEGQTARPAETKSLKKNKK